VLKIAALGVAAASAALAVSASASSPALIVNAPWWEKVTVTITGDGQAQGCRYETSFGANAQSCEVSGSAASAASDGGASAKDQYTRITFERRFSPGATPDSGALQAGDTLLGRQVMALAIDGAGAVKGCNIVASGGSMTPDYGCAEAKTERFKTSVSKTPSTTHEAYMTVIVYGHAEHVV
jgi:hypothetical protein